MAKKKLKGEPKPKLAKVYIVQRDSLRDDVIEQMYIDGIMMDEKRGEEGWRVHTLRKHGTH